MDETAAELQQLQELIDRSFASANEHLRAIMTPERQLTAEQVVAQLPSPAVLNLATVTARGEPRISAVDGHFRHGRWFFTTSDFAAKAAHLHARPAVSASYTPRDGFGVFCHGRAAFLAAGPERDELRAHLIATYGQDPAEFGPDVVYLRLDADWLTAFAMTAQEQAEIDRMRANR
jgi:hypothetical protein